MNFRFATPLAFLLLVPWAAAAWRMLRRGRHAGVLFSATRHLPPRTAGWRVRAARLLPPVFLAGLFLLVVAAARPQGWLEREHRDIDAIAIMMAVDISGSMEALDLSPRDARSRSDLRTRLQVAKDLFERFVEKRQDDLVGLVTFGGYAATRCPLTADHAALGQVLRGVEIPTAQAPDAGGAPVSQEEFLTAIGDGLATACARLVDAEPATRVVVLLSDGISNTGLLSPEQAAEAAAKLGIRVYTIGIGTNGRAPFLVRDDFGREVVREFDTEFDEAQLRSIADTTRGRYFHVDDAEGFRKALEEIDRLETTPVERTTYSQFDERFALPLAAGAALVLVSSLLSAYLSRRPL